MANIELVIKIPEEDFEIMKHNVMVNNPLCPLSQEKMVAIIAKGIPLPKRHGKLKDVDKIISDGRSKGFCDWYDEMKYATTIIEENEEV